MTEPRPAADGPEPMVDVEAIVAEVLAVDDVVALHSGPFGEVGTHLPGRRIAGVRLDESGDVDIHVVIRWGATAPEVADTVRRSVAPLFPGKVNVTIEDVAPEVDDAG